MYRKTLSRFVSEAKPLADVCVDSEQSQNKLTLMVGTERHLADSTESIHAQRCDSFLLDMIRRIRKHE